MPDENDIRTLDIPQSSFEVRDAKKRELGLFIVPWNTVVETPMGPEEFRKGAFSQVDPTRVRLRMDHQDPPTGRGLAIEERDDGAYMSFQVARTARGDEQLTLAQEGVSTGASVGFRELPGGTAIETRNGRRVRVHSLVDLPEVSTTWRPAYEQASVMYVRSKEEENEPVSEDTHAETPDQLIAASAQREMVAAIEAFQKRTDERSLTIIDRLEAIEERNRKDIIVPAQSTTVTQERQESRTGMWVQTALRVMTGERVSDLQLRSLDDLITSDNIGVVPDTVSTELIGVIDPQRPFLDSTRRLSTPPTGLTLTVPILVTRPTVGIQDPEKEDIASTITQIQSQGFDAVTVAGGGDISIQLLKRSSPSYLELYIRLLAEALAIESDNLAIATILDSGVTPGTGYIDPDDLLIGESFANAAAVKKRANRMWMSTAAVVAFIDAKEDTTNAPLYWNLASDITVANGTRGQISGLLPIWTPALDGSGADVLIGPDDGFAWAEDGSFTLQVDVPSKAGRDVALVSIYWFAPLYPAAFTSYRLGS